MLGVVGVFVGGSHVLPGTLALARLAGRSGKKGCWLDGLPSGRFGRRGKGPPPPIEPLRQHCGVQPPSLASRFPCFRLGMAGGDVTHSFIVETLFYKRPI